MDKAPDAFRTISEVAESLDVPQHVLRFWENRFTQIKPMKRSGGRRYYRREDVLLLRGIRHLLYGEGYTIRGVQRILREQGVKAVQGFDGAAMQGTSPRDAFEDAGDREQDDALQPDDAFDDAEGEETSADDGQPLVADEREPRSAPREARAAPVPQQPAKASPEVIIVNRISDDNLALLRSALSELVECRKVLEQAAGGA